MFGMIGGKRDDSITLELLIAHKCTRPLFYLAGALLITCHKIIYKNRILPNSFFSTRILTSHHQPHDSRRVDYRRTAMHVYPVADVAAASEDHSVARQSPPEHLEEDT